MGEEELVPLFPFHICYLTLYTASTFFFLLLRRSLFLSILRLHPLQQHTKRLNTTSIFFPASSSHTIYQRYSDILIHYWTWRIQDCCIHCSTKILLVSVVVVLVYQTISVKVWQGRLSWRTSCAISSLCTIPPAKPTGPPATIPTYNKEREDIFETCGCPIFVVLSRMFSSTSKCFRRQTGFLASFSLLNRPSKINLCYSPPPVNSSWNSACCFNILKKTVTKFWHVRAKIRCKEKIWRQCITGEKVGNQSGWGVPHTPIHSANLC